MKHVALSIALLAAACGSKEEKKDEAAKADPTAAEKKAAPEKKAEPAPAPVDPATFVDVDLSSVPRLAGHTAKAPPGATVTADPPGFGDEGITGGVIAKDGFALHLWWSTTGGERTVLPMKADLEGRGKYVETACNPDLCEYTIVRHREAEEVVTAPG